MINRGLRSKGGGDAPNPPDLLYTLKPIDRTAKSGATTVHWFGGDTSDICWKNRLAYFENCSVCGINDVHRGREEISAPERNFGRNVAALYLLVKPYFEMNSAFVFGRLSRTRSPVRTTFLRQGHLNSVPRISSAELRFLIVGSDREDTGSSSNIQPRGMPLVGGMKFDAGWWSILMKPVVNEL